MAPRNTCFTPATIKFSRIQCYITWHCPLMVLTPPQLSTCKTQSSEGLPLVGNECEALPRTLSRHYLFPRILTAMQPTSMSQLKTSKLPHNCVCNRKSTLLRMAVVLLLRMKMPSTFRKLSSLFVFVKMSSKNPESAKFLSSIYL